MSDELAPDEKRCPFCAEVIRAAAIKCRFCQSDLPIEPREVGPPPEWTPTRPAPSVRQIRLTAVLSVVCLLLVALVGYLSWRSFHPPADAAPNGQITSNSFRNAAMSAATEAATTALSYSYKTFAEDREKAIALLGDDLAEEYAGVMDQVEEQTMSAKLTLTATVLSAGLISAEEHEAGVLLFVNTVTTREGSDQQQLDQNRIRMTLTRGDGDWTVTEMEAF